jgi:hypothetical protein
MSLKDVMLLSYTSNRYCTDERDKVYGFLNILRGEDLDDDSILY